MVRLPGATYVDATLLLIGSGTVVIVISMRQGITQQLTEVYLRVLGEPVEDVAVWTDDMDNIQPIMPQSNR